MRKFIGRQKEIDLLKQDLNSLHSQLTIILGRRGVGKTTTLYHFLQKYGTKYIFNFVGNNKVKAKEQQQNFIKEIEKKLGVKNTASISNWKDAFDFLYSQLSNISSKITLTFDEFAWFNTKDSGFAEYFGEFWNKVNFNLNVFCILSGSSISWMNKNVLRAKGSLYHKANNVIRLRAFSYLETLEYFEGRDFSDKIINQYYLVTGGIPRYLDKIRDHLNLEENLKNIFNQFNNGLEKEFDNLFSSTFNTAKTSIHKDIVLLYQNRNKLATKEIVSKLSARYSIPTIYSALNDLEASDMLRNIPNHFNKKQSSYMLIDLFCFFNVKFFYKKNVAQIEDNELLDKYNGYAFEILAYLNVELIKERLSRNGFKSIEYGFQDDNTQIDLIIDYGKHRYSLVECKYYNQPITITSSLENDLLKKKQVFISHLKKSKRIKRYDVDLILFSLYGTQNRSKNISFHDVNLS